jgi:pimeloyl-ACP methyl ester carboxylesterase
VAERMIRADGVELCTESFGDPADPPVVLVAGMAGSMLFWEEPFVRLLVDGGRFVVRYDHRDTGRSTTYPPGKPGYTSVDLVDDVVRVMDGYNIDAAHVVGVSMGGALAQLVALDHPNRVGSLVLISTSLALRDGRELPGATDPLKAFWAAPVPDDRTGYVVDYMRVLHGTRSFDDDSVCALVRRDAERAHDPAAGDNHALLDDGDRERGSLSDISAPTLVVHGSADPMFPPTHAEALVDSIPGGTLLRLEGAGHGVESHDWDELARAIVAHTGQTAAAARRGSSSSWPSRSADGSYDCDATSS